MFYVRMTDSFLSGWGNAEGKINVLVVECQTELQAQQILKAGRARPEMRRLKVCVSKPEHREGILYSWRRFADMSGPWLE